VKNRVQDTIDNFKKDLEMVLDGKIGTEIEAHGKKWLIIKTLYNDCYLAIELNIQLPCPVQVICTREE